jgi:hypothetical protein
VPQTLTSRLSLNAGSWALSGAQDPHNDLPVLPVTVSDHALAHWDSEMEYGLTSIHVQLWRSPGSAF